MNLTKLFNFKYLKQNLKKSKGVLMVFLSIVPIFTFLVMLISGNDWFIGPADVMEISIINILGLFIVPIVMSISLFGYAFQRKSIDFINSMPINRKTIFLTNTLAGIILIIIMQLINMLGLFLVRTINENIIIFSGMIVDMFLYFTVSYIFMFVATNIAMSLAGNMPTQIVLTMLIIFFVPFTAGAINNTIFSNSETFDFFRNGKEIGYIRAETPIEETMPYRLIKLGFNNSLDELYNQKSIYRMLFLSVVYIGIGLYLFKKRKFENAQESFENKYVHFFTKALTIFPMIMVLSIFHYLETEIGIILFCFAFIIAYYFIYDLVTSKKIKFKASIINLVLTLVVLNGICYGIVEMTENGENKKIKREDIQGIAININNVHRNGMDTQKILDYYIEDEELIDYIYYISDIDIEDKIYRYSDTDPYSIARIKLKNGKICDTNLIFNTNRISKRELEEKLIKKLETDKKYVELYKEQYKNEGIFAIDGIQISKEENENLMESLNNYIDNCSFRDLIDRNYSNDLSKYVYSNHRLITYTMREDISQEFFNNITAINNERTAEILKNIEKDYDFYDFNIFNAKKDTFKSCTNEDKRLELINIMLETYKNKVDLNKEFFTINAYGYGSKDSALSVRIKFYTQDSRIAEIFESIEEADFYKDYEIEDYNIDEDLLDDGYITTIVNDIENSNIIEGNFVTNEITDIKNETIKKE